MRNSFLSFVVILVTSAAALGAEPASRPTFTLHVNDPAGRPAAGALAVLVPPGHSAAVTDGKSFDDDPAFVRATCDERGELNFATRPPQALLVVIHPDGWIAQSVDKLGDHVSLSRWASIHGRRLINNKPGIARKITIWSMQNESTPYDPQVPTAMFTSAPTTDDAGEFVIERISSGDAMVADATVYQSQGNSALDRPLVKVDLQSGTINTATLGGPGRTIRGRVIVPPELAGRDDWEYLHCVVWQNEMKVQATTLPADVGGAAMSKQIEWWEHFARDQSEADKQQAEARKQAAYQYSWAHTYPFDVQADNTFTVDGVASGKYQLELEIRSKRVGNKRGVNLAHALVDLVVPAGEDEAPIVLPPIEPKAVSEPKIGEAAPDFEVPGLDDRPVRLSDYRGQIVLLDFWATWCGPCVAEMPNLKTIYERFGATNQIVMLGLTSDERPDLPAEFARLHDIRWRQGFLGGENDAVSKLYGVSGIPSVWLIDREGKVIARDLRDEKTAATIEKALNKKLKR